jgi:hypothetical protein
VASAVEDLGWVGYKPIQKPELTSPTSCWVSAAQLVSVDLLPYCAGRLAGFMVLAAHAASHWVCCSVL